MHRVRIRSAEERDVGAMLEIYGPFIRDSAISFELEVPEAPRFWQRVRSYQTSAPWLVCTLDGAVAGYAYAGDHRSRAAYRWTKEVSVYVHPDFRKRNIATALYTVLFRLLELQGCRNALAGIVQPNPASVRFHEHMGFQLVGIYHKIGYKMGRWHEVGWWERSLGDDGAPPEVVRQPDELDSRLWHEAIRAGVALIR